MLRSLGKELFEFSLEYSFNTLERRDMRNTILFMLDSITYNIEQESQRTDLGAVAVLTKKNDKNVTSS